ncbi:MAG TPA: inorganic phosphate transporter [Pyrinomonadaceae bacterium]|jgi:PiT family inorganic phosphate transporter
MLIVLGLFLATLFLAYSNGANDNFKGVATLFGSGTTNYKRAIGWATLTTLGGSVCSIFLAEALVKNFSGKGLVPEVLTVSPQFLLAVAVGAGLTVMLATLTGFPVSTTHGLTGALAGAGLAAVGAQVNFARLGSSFVLPLLLSPVLAVGLGMIFYFLARALRVKCGVSKEWCVCIGETTQIIPIPQPNSVLSLARIALPQIAVGTTAQCTQRYQGNMLGVSVQKLVDLLHFLSAGTVSFARGLNDTPKIVALVLVINAVGVRWGMIAVASGMALGGLINARRVALTMSRKITPLNHGQGFTANLVTAALVISASRWGLPVSTTHVSVGSLFGIGLITRQANTRVILGILLSWVLTLPIAAILGGVVYKLLIQV